MKQVIQFLKNSREHNCSITIEYNDDPTKNKSLLCKGVDMPKSIIDKLEKIVEKEIEGLNIHTWIAMNIFVDQSDGFHAIFNYRNNPTASGHQQHRFTGLINITDKELSDIKSKEKAL